MPWVRENFSLNGHAYGAGNRGSSRRAAAGTPDGNAGRGARGTSGPSSIRTAVGAAGVAVAGTTAAIITAASAAASNRLATELLDDLCVAVQEWQDLVGRTRGSVRHDFCDAKFREVLELALVGRRSKRDDV